MDKPVISFCIPTYNRCELLLENVNEIIIQAKNQKINVEICISDNCSTDNTKNVMEALIPPSGIRLIYHRNENNIGPDLNYLKSVDLAQGNYCWFLGSDDKIAEGCIDKFLKIHENVNSDIYLCERIDCNIEMIPFGKTKWSKINELKTCNLNDSKELISYFDDSISLGALFSYLSSIIFNKNVWDLIDYDDQFTGTAYSHVYKLLKFKDYNTTLTYIPDAYVMCRHGNDHFMANGFTKRFLIDIDGYLLLSDVLFENEKELKNSFLKVMKREHDYWYLLFIRSVSDSKEWPNIVEKLIKYSYSHFIVSWTFILPKKLCFMIFKLSNMYKKIIAFIVRILQKQPSI